MPDRRYRAFYPEIGVTVSSYDSIDTRLAYGHIWNRHPLLIFAVLLVVVGVQLFTTGLLGEMMVDAGSRIDEDYEAAAQTIIRLVIRGCEVEENAPAASEQVHRA